jgi:hypothetical protein
MMKTIQILNKIRAVLFVFISALFLMIAFHGTVEAQVKSVIVENYYKADANDITDTLARALMPGAKTYRIYLEVEPGSKLRKIFGDSLHPLVVKSDSVFYNNTDRPSNEFGYELQMSWFEDNPILALDSWFTLGLAAKGQKGVLKQNDADGNNIAGVNNLGGTAAIPGGLLVNSDSFTAIPLTTADGYVPYTTALGSWLDYGFKDFAGNDTTVFGADSIGNEFYCVGCALQQQVGIIGPVADSNKILLAQVTTAGILEFKLNVTLEQVDPQSGNIVLVDYVANDDTLRPGEVVSASLTYPLACGCNDPDYLEYSGSFTCFEADSCKTLIVFGCMDSSACNYDPDANFNLPNLCCYPGKCNDLDISKVCPDLNLGRFGSASILAYPNPAVDELTIEVLSKNKQSVTLEIYNATGSLVYSDVINLDEQITVSKHSIRDLNDGIYLLRVSGQGFNDTLKLIKNK